MVSAEARGDSSAAIVVGGTCRHQLDDDNLSTSNRSSRLSLTHSTVSSVSTPTVCTLVPVVNIRHSTTAANRSTDTPNTSIDHYQSVTSLPPPPLPPHPQHSLSQSQSRRTDDLESLNEMLVLVQANSDQSSACHPTEQNRSCSDEMNKPMLISRQRMPPVAANLRQMQSFPLDDCCSCRSIVTEPEHRVLSNPNLPIANDKQSEEESESSQFIFYLLLKKLFSIFRRKRKKDRKKRRVGKPGNEGSDKCHLNPASGGKVRRSGSVYSRCSMVTRRSNKLTGHCRFDQNVTFYRPPSRRYNSCNQTKPLLVDDDCEECRREAQAIAQHRRPPSRRGSRRLRRQSSAVERFARQHRFIMSMLGRQRFGVSRMFENLPRGKDYRPNYQFLNQLLYQGVIRNRMSGYRYNLIRPILADVPEDEEVDHRQEHSQPRPKSRQRQNRHYQPPPPPVPPPSVQNCCGESVYARQPPRSRAPSNGQSQPPVLRAHSKVSSLGYSRLSGGQAPNGRASKRSGPPSRQSRLVQAPTATDCIDCIISQLKSSSRFKAPSICTCCDCQAGSILPLPFPHSSTVTEEPMYKCSEFYPFRPQPSANRRSFGPSVDSRNMSTRRRKMMCKKFDSMVVQESFQCHSQQVSVTRAEQHYGGQNDSTAARPKNASLYQSTAGKSQVKSRRSSLPTSSSSECSSSGSSRTSKYLQQCTCCMGAGQSRPVGSTSDHSRPPTAKQQRRHFEASQFTAPKLSHHSNAPSCSTSVMQVPLHSACFCPGCIAMQNMVVAKL